MFLFLLQFLILPFCPYGVEFYTGLVNKKAVRLIDLTTPVEKISLTAEVQNKGKKPTKFYLVPIPKKLQKKFAFVLVCPFFFHFLIRIRKKKLQNDVASYP